MKLNFCFLLFLCPIFRVMAQENITAKGLQPGDKVPALAFHITNYQKAKPTATVPDFHGTLLILEPVRYPDPQQVLDAIAGKLKALRLASNEVNYEKFAFKHDLSRSQVWRYEHGEDFKISSLIRLLNAHDISLHEFFDMEFEKRIK